MGVAVAYPYSKFWRLRNTGGVDLDTDTLKIALVTSAYTPSLAHTQWADVSANEVSSGSGYTTGGITLSGVTAADANIDFDDPVWTSLTKTFRYAVCYKSGSGGGYTNPLLFYVLLNSDPADIVSSGSNYSLIINATNKLFYNPNP